MMAMLMVDDVVLAAGNVGFPNDGGNRVIAHQQYLQPHPTWRRWGDH